MWLWSKSANDIASVHSQSYGLTDRWQKTSPLNWPIRSLYRVEYHQLTWYNSVWLWRWLPHRLSKRESRSTITVLSRALCPIQDFVHLDDHTQPSLLMNWLLGSNLSQKWNVWALGHFTFSPKFWKFRLENKWNGPFRFGPTGIISKDGKVQLSGYLPLWI